jgi:Spy/CpxP family protein refolding chaperone
MRKLLVTTAALATVLVLAGSASAQGKKGKFGKGGFGPFGLLMNADVQKDLKLTDEQITKIKELSDKQAAAFKELFGIQDKEERGKKFKEMNEANKKAIDDVLQPEQTKRLEQLQLQQGGAGALLRSKIKEKLDLTQDQVEKIQQLLKDAGPKFKEAFEGFFEASKEEKEATMKKVAEVSKSLLADALKILNDDQKKAFEEMRGAPYNGTLPFGGFGGLGMGMGGGGASLQVEPMRAPRRPTIAALA